MLKLFYLRKDLIMNKKKILLGTLIGCLTLELIHYSNKGNTQIDTSITYYDGFDENDKGLYATFNGRNIFIFDESYIEPIKTYYIENTYIDTYNDNVITIKDDDIIVIDLRNKKQNMKILSSYKIEKTKEQEAILDVIIDYSLKYPANKEWNRSKEAMLKEWEVHNFLYNLNLYLSHTRDVDFEEKEEKQYQLKF
jgi:hypothetical protein